MPDFDTRTRQVPDEPNRHRSLSIASRVRNRLIAVRLRNLLIGGGILLYVVVAVPIGLIGYSYSGLAPETVTCDEFMLGKVGDCNAPTEGDLVEVCKADSRVEVESLARCRVAPSNFLDWMKTRIWMAFPQPERVLVHGRWTMWDMTQVKK
jgi:hypothetical protein